MVTMLAGCSASHESPTVEVCPTLVVGEASWVGIFVAPGQTEPDACVSAHVDGRRVAQTRATFEGSFAMRFAARGDQRDRPFELRLPNRAMRVVAGGDTEATIAYDPNTLPLVERPNGFVRFSGWLAPEPDATPIATAWMLNWTRGQVVELVESPELERPFEARVRGGWLDEAGVASRHASGGVGGCWWPGGGGGTVACPDDARTSGVCSEPGDCRCTGRRGCDPLDVDERSSGTPPPELSDSIPVRDDRPVPTDAGPPDGGPVADGGLM